MGQMASRAAFDLDGFMLIHKWAGFVGVAFEANQVLRLCRSQLTVLEAAMRIMTIGALHYSFVYAMMERSVELLLLIQVAAVAECWLLIFQQKLALLCMVRVVAIRAGHSVLKVDGACIIAVLLPILMAIEAAGADLLCRCALKRENLSLISAAFDVCFPWPMASFATMPLRAFLCIQGRHIVRSIFKVLEEILGGHVRMAGLARFSAYVKRGIRRARVGLLIRFAV